MKKENYQLTVDLIAPLFALGGDIGCSGGPTFAGMMASALGDNLKAGILAAVIFPVLMGVCLIIRKTCKASVQEA